MASDEETPGSDCSTRTITETIRMSCCFSHTQISVLQFLNKAIRISSVLVLIKEKAENKLPDFYNVNNNKQYLKTTNSCWILGV